MQIDRQNVMLQSQFIDFVDEDEESDSKILSKLDIHQSSKVAPKVVEQSVPKVVTPKVTAPVVAHVQAKVEVQAKAEAKV